MATLSAARQLSELKMSQLVLNGAAPEQAMTSMLGQMFRAMTRVGEPNRSGPEAKVTAL